MNELLRFEPYIEYDDEDGHATMSVDKNGEYVSYEDAMNIIDELQNRLVVALDCLDACHGMEMYWKEFPTEVKCHGHGEFYSDYEIASALNWQEYDEKRRELLGLPKENSYKPVELPIIRRVFPKFK